MEDDINKFIIDKYFNIYNRNGFDYMMKLVQHDSKIYLLDFNNIKKLNNRLGYKNVNEIFNKTFLELKKKYLIGRAFSGDEIFFHTYNIKDNIEHINEICSKNGLSFKYIEKIYYKNEKDNIENILEKMIENFH